MGIEGSGLNMDATVTIVIRRDGDTGRGVGSEGKCKTCCVKRWNTETIGSEGNVKCYEN